MYPRIYALSSTPPFLCYTLYIFLKIGVISSEPRGIAFDSKGYFYIAHKQQGILVFNANNDVNLQVNTQSISCPSCIGVTYDIETNTIFSGSSLDHYVRQFEVWEESNNSSSSSGNNTTQSKGGLKLIKTFGHKHKLKHPAGIAVYENKLYIASQATSSIVTFDIVTGKLLHSFKTSEKDAIEDLILSPC